jgi:cytochrome c-type biogenesis protein CcmH
MMLAGLLLLALVLLALWFAMRDPDVLEDRYATEVAHHRGALARIAAEAHQPQEAQALTLDVQRRLLRVRRGDASPARRSNPIWSYAVAVACMGLALFGYVKLGNHSLADVPASKVQAPLVAAQNYQSAKALLEKDPGNISAWIDLSIALQDQGEAARAFEALEIATHAMPDVADLWVARGQALVIHGGGMVSPAARFAFDRASVLDPKHPGPRLYLALAWLQAGQPRQALPLLESLTKDSPKDAPWLPRVERMTRGAKAMIAAGVGAD